MSKQSKYFSAWEERVQREAVYLKNLRITSDPEFAKLYEQSWTAGLVVRAYGTLLAAEEAKLQPLRNQVTDSLRELRKQLAALYDTEPHFIELGNWECEASPTGHCIYNISRDRSRDDCVVCHDPEERK